MDSYHKVVVPQKRNQENEIFVNSKSPASHLLSRVVALFKEKNYTEVTFRATGGAISTAVTVAELTKRRVEGLHQITTIGTTDVSSVFEPTIEGLDKHEQTRLVSSIVILLSSKQLDEKTPGYQAPLSAADFQAAQEFNRPQRTGPPRGRPSNGQRPRQRSPRPSEGGDQEGAASSAAPGTTQGQSRQPRGPRGPRRGGRGPRVPRTEGGNQGAPQEGGNATEGAAPRQPRQGGNGPRRGGNGPRRGGPRHNGPRRPAGGDAPSNAAPAATQ